MSIEIISYESRYFDELKNLLNEVYSSNITKGELEKNYVNEDSKKILLAIHSQTKNVIGCAFIEERIDYVRVYHYLFVTYVAVNEKYRKQGVGRVLFDAIEDEAFQKEAEAIELTSADYREDAHAFYSALGFSKKKTTVFIKDGMSHKHSLTVRFKNTYGIFENVYITSSKQIIKDQRKCWSNATPLGFLIKYSQNADINDSRVLAEFSSEELRNKAYQEIIDALSNNNVVYTLRGNIQRGEK